MRSASDCRPLSFGTPWLAILSFFVTVAALIYVFNPPFDTQAYASIRVAKDKNEIVLKGYIRQRNGKPISNVEVDVYDEKSLLAKGKSNANGYFKITITGAVRHVYTISWVHDNRTIKKDVPLFTKYWQKVQQRGGMWMSPKKGESVSEFVKRITSKYGISVSNVKLTNKHHCFIQWKYLKLPNQDFTYRLEVTHSFTLLGVQTFAY